MKRSKILALCCLLFWCSSLAFAQSAPTATWDDFDKLMLTLQNEIDSLNSQIANMSANLTQSQAELQTLKQQLQERETAYNALNQSLDKYKQSLQSSELKASRSTTAAILAGIVAAASIGLNVYLILH